MPIGRSFTKLPHMALHKRAHRIGNSKSRPNLGRRGRHVRYANVKYYFLLRRINPSPNRPVPKRMKEMGSGFATMETFEKTIS